MRLEEFFDIYSTKHTSREKLSFLNDASFDFISNDGKEEAALLSIFIELLKGNTEEAGKRSEDELLKKNHLLYEIGQGIYYVSVGRREYKCEYLQRSIGCFEEAISRKGDIPFIYVRFARACRYMGNLCAGESDAKDYYDRAAGLIKKAKDMVCGRNKTALSYFYTELGDTYMDSREFDYAISSFSQAVGCDDRLAIPHIGKGNYFRSQNDYEEAVENYREALRCLGYKKNIRNHAECMYPLNYMGDCYRFMEDYGRSQEKYIEAIHVNPGHAFPWHGLGRVLYELGNRNSNNAEYYNIAVKYFDKSLSINPHFKHALYSYARVYEKMGEYNKAIKYYKDSINAFPKSSYHENKAVDRKKEAEKNKRLESKIRYLKSKEINDELSSVEKIIVNTIGSRINERVFLKKDSFTQSFLKESYYNKKEDESSVILDILRRWNSFTPIITDNSKGGGYFIRALGRGIVIDPGFNFIDNFKDAGYAFSDIDIVLISHAHDDHTADLESIISLLHRYNKELKERKLPKQIAKENNTSIHSIKAEGQDLKNRFNHYKKILSLYVSRGVMKKYRPLFDQDMHYLPNDKNFLNRYDDSIGDKSKDHFDIYGVKEIKLEEDGAENIIDLSKEACIGSPDIKISAIKAKHKDIIKGVKSIGFKIVFEKTILVYTGDSGWNRELEEQYTDIRENKGDKHIVLLAHIGGFHGDENKLVDYIDEKALPTAVKYKGTGEKNLKKCLYGNHLGRIGMVRINEVLEPDLCIISEFGEEFKGLRTEVVEAFTGVFAGKIKTCFIPADIGLKINISDLKVRVISKIDRENHRIEYEYVSPDKVRVGEYKKLNQLFYYKKCRSICENDCLQALSEDFREDYDDFCMLDRQKYILKSFQDDDIL